MSPLRIERFSEKEGKWSDQGMIHPGSSLTCFTNRTVDGGRVDYFLSCGNDDTKSFLLIVRNNNLKLAEEIVLKLNYPYQVSLRNKYGVISQYCFTHIKK